MITQGRVNDQLEAIIVLHVVGPAGVGLDVEAMVDTGFNGYVALPSALVRHLDLRFHSNTPAELADGSPVTLSKYRGHLIWGGVQRPILVLEAEGGALVGMRLLRSHRLTIDVRLGGDVGVAPLR